MADDICIPNGKLSQQSLVPRHYECFQLGPRTTQHRLLDTAWLLIRMGVVTKLDFACVPRLSDMVKDRQILMFSKYLRLRFWGQSAVLKSAHCPRFLIGNHDIVYMYTTDDTLVDPENPPDPPLKPFARVSEETGKLVYEQGHSEASVFPGI